MIPLDTVRSGSNPSRNSLENPRVERVWVAEEGSRIRIVIVSPNRVGRVATRKSTTLTSPFLRVRIRKLPSCGRLFSVMSMCARIFIRAITER